MNDFIPDTTGYGIGGIVVSVVILWGYAISLWVSSRRLARRERRRKMLE